MAEYKLELKNVSKSFPGVKALDGVQLSLRPGSVFTIWMKVKFIWMVKK